MKNNVSDKNSLVAFVATIFGEVKNLYPDVFLIELA